MQCPSCNFMNVPGMRFCGQCGARLAVPLDCPVCSFLNAAGMRFCGQCGSALFVGAAAAPARIDPVGATGGGSIAEPPGVSGLARLVPTIDERKVVTILFGD